MAGYVALQGGEGGPPYVKHPLDQLTPGEVRAASGCVLLHAKRLGVEESPRFNTITLKEPPKAALLRYERGTGPRPPRLALCVLLLPASNAAATCVVDLGAAEGGRVLQWEQLDGVHPMTTPDDNTLAEEVVKADPTVRRLLAERYGVADPALLVCDTWACHNAPAHLNHLRLMQGFLYLRMMPGDNEYAHPLDLVPIVDLNARRVVHIDMNATPPAVPKQMSNYRSDLVDPAAMRSDIKPLNITQPEGPSFTVEGSLVRWQRWRLRVGFNYREGLVLHQVGYEDPERGGELRPILHRASLVEMAVPYGDPNYIMARKCAMDSGDYGFGFCANSLVLGCDCLGHIKYFDGVVSNARGEPVVIPNAVCMHEEDAGILWKHFDSRTGRVEVRRARKLVVQTVSTFQNYEYIMAWEFWQDGSIHFVMKLSGILSTSLAPEGEGPRPTFGVRVAPGVNATVHQHFFCVRLDPSIDDEEGGRSVVVSEVESVPLPVGPANPCGNAFVMRETDLASTQAAQRTVDFSTARCWLLKNPNSTNPVSGEAAAYRLMPGPTPAMMMAPDSLVWRRALFATKNLWVTPYAEGQLYPAGDHVVQSRDCLGLREWTREDRPLLGGRDPVVWYSFGITHAPRIEDFPVMPVEVVGFMLRPASFFTGNPAVDVPPTHNKASTLHSGGGGGTAPASPGQQQQQDGSACCSGGGSAVAALLAVVHRPRSRM